MIGFSPHRAQFFYLPLNLTVFMEPVRQSIRIIFEAKLGAPIMSLTASSASNNPIIPGATPITPTSLQDYVDLGH